MIINGLDVAFPYQPYNVQHAIMSMALSVLKGGVNALPEAPTGSGKTLAVLCATLAWLAGRRSEVS